jgi:hypothetical protein
VKSLPRTPKDRWLVCPPWWSGSSHDWLAGYRGEMREEPMVFAFQDRKSYIAGFLVLAVLWLAMVL